jgi:hypothetical protein
VVRGVFMAAPGYRKERRRPSDGGPATEATMRL